MHHSESFEVSSNCSNPLISLNNFWFPVQFRQPLFRNIFKRFLNYLAHIIKFPLTFADLTFCNLFSKLLTSSLPYEFNLKRTAFISCFTCVI